MSWLRDWLDRAPAQRAKQTVIVAKARAELATSDWSAEDEASFQAIRGKQGRFLEAHAGGGRAMAVEITRFRMAVVGGAGSFSPLSPGEKRQLVAAAIGPGSNTGQNGQQDAIIDYLTIVVPLSALEEVNCKKLDLLLLRIFGFRGEVVAGAIREKDWNFYEESAVLIDRENEAVGRVGIGGKKSTVCLSLTGIGCTRVRTCAVRTARGTNAATARYGIAHNV